MKTLNKLTFTLFAVIAFTSICFADSKRITPVINFMLEDGTPSHLEKVLREYELSDSSHIFVAAHRGGKEDDAADGAPGNSIANIQNAVSKGFDFYESDIEILGDNTLLVFHDNDFDNLTNSDVDGDLLEDADLAYAKSLFLTYDDGTVSGEKIPTFEEFLTAGKGQIMFKFDLKSGTFGTSVLKNIFATVVATQTVDQVLIRGGDNVLSVAKANGYDTKMIMRKYNSPPTVSDISNLVDLYEVRAISIPDGASNEVINAAIAEGLVVEVHEIQGVDDMTREADISAKIAQGVRQFHSFKPSQLMMFLKAGQHRNF